MQGVQVRSLVRELGSCMLHGSTKIIIIIIDTGDGLSVPCVCQSLSGCLGSGVGAPEERSLQRGNQEKNTVSGGDRSGKGKHRTPAQVPSFPGPALLAPWGTFSGSLPHGSTQITEPWVLFSCESVSRLVVSNCLQPHGYSVHGILQARILEWVTRSFSRGSSRPRDGTQVSHIAGRFYHVSHQGSPLFS